MHLQQNHLTDIAIKAFYKVYNNLGYGFLEKVYENAMIIELRKSALHIAAQQNMKVFYETLEVGYYVADIIIENKVILEIKATDGIREEHEYQLINYLKASQIEVGLLLNFGKSPQFKRKVFTNI